jgi:diguanylate cyclase (GGDEF)-like protein
MSGIFLNIGEFVVSIVRPMTKKEEFNGQENDTGSPKVKEEKNFWNRLVGLSTETEEASRSRLLNGILLILIPLGSLAVLEYGIREGFIVRVNSVPATAIVFLIAAYLLNRRGQFKSAVWLSLGTITLSVFAILWQFHSSRNDFNILFYLIVPLLFAEFFLPLTGYILVSVLILLGLVFIPQYDPAVKDITSFIIIVSFLVGASGYYSQKLENNRRERLLSIERHHARQMELLNSITHTALQMPDTQQALQVLADRLGQLMNADGAFITLWDEERQKVIPSTAYGEFKDTYKDTMIEPEEKTLTASVLREKRPIAVEDVLNTPYMSPRLASDVPTRSALVLPLIAHDKKLGAAIISYNQTHPFTKEEIALGEQASGQIALALLKIQSLENERRHARQMELLNSITYASLNASNFQEMTQILADRMGELLKADGAFLTIWNEKQNRTIPTAAYGTYRQVYANLKFNSSDKTITASVLEAGRTLIVEDVFNTPYMSRNIAERFSTRSILALPMIVNGRKLGAALIAFDQPHRFTPREVEVGERAVAQIALAVYKSHLIEVSLRQVDQLELLAEVGRNIANSLDEKEILDLAIGAVVKRFGYAAASISLLVNNDILEVAAINGTQDFGYRVGYQQKLGSGIIGHIAETRKPYLSGDISKDPYYYSTAKRDGSALGVPILDKEDLLGVLYAETTRQNDFRPDDVQLMQTLANQVANSIQKARLYARTQNHLQAMTTLQSVSQVVSSSLDRDEILHNVVHLLQDTFGYTYISIYLLESDTLHLGAQVGYPEDMVIHDIPVRSGVAGRTVLTQQTQFISDVSQDSSFLRASTEVKSEICVPLIRENVVLGVLNVESASGTPLNESDLDLLNAIAGPITIAIDNARLHAQVKTLAMTDAVSGLYNRHAFEDMLLIEIQRAVRYGLPLSLIIFDVDSFKDYNDTWGHPAGDERLRGIAGLIRTSQRTNDIAARYGGDEFAIILPSTNKEGAYQFAKRLCDATRNSTTEKPIDGKGIPGYTISMGFATFPQDGDTLATLLLAADQAALTAKRLGKNQIASAGNTTGHGPTSTFPHHDPDR